MSTQTQTKTEYIVEVERGEFLALTGYVHGPERKLTTDFAEVEGSPTFEDALAKLLQWTPSGAYWEIHRRETVTTVTLL